MTSAGRLPELVATAAARPSPPRSTTRLVLKPPTCESTHPKGKPKRCFLNVTRQTDEEHHHSILGNERAAAAAVAAARRGRCTWPLPHPGQAVVQSLPCVVKLDPQKENNKKRTSNQAKQEDYFPPLHLCCHSDRLGELFGSVQRLSVVGDVSDSPRQ